MEIQSKYFRATIFSILTGTGAKNNFRKRSIKASKECFPFLALMLVFLAIVCTRQNFSSVCPLSLIAHNMNLVKNAYKPKKILSAFVFKVCYSSLAQLQTDLQQQCFPSPKYILTKHFTVLRLQWSCQKS